MEQAAQKRESLFCASCLFLPNACGAVVWNAGNNAIFVAQAQRVGVRATGNSLAMFEGIDWVLAVVILGLLLSSSYLLGSRILKPLRQAAQKPPPRTQYYITDIYVLLGQFGLAGLIVFNAGADGQQSFNLARMFCVWALLAWWWRLGVRDLSRARIVGAKRRAALLGVGGPLAYGVPFLFVLSWLYFLPGSIQRLFVLFVPAPWDSQQALLLAAICPLLVIVVASGRALARWVAAGAANTSDTSDVSDVSDVSDADADGAGD